MRGLVFALTPTEYVLALRTERSLRAAGLQDVAIVFGEPALATALQSAEVLCCLLQAGAWLAKGRWQEIPSSATGRPLAAYGRTRGEPSRSLYLETAAARLLGSFLERMSWPQAMDAVLKDRRIRAVQLPELTVEYDSSLRVLQVVTSIQLGGAERVTLDLAEELNRHTHRAWIAALGRAQRASYPIPVGFYDLSKQPHREARAVAIGRLASELHLDVLHGHLLSGAESEALYATGLPVVMTMHNLPQAWPRAFVETAHRCDLLIACCRAVGSAVADAGVPAACRTAWNGIAAGRFSPTPEALAAGRAWRVGQSWGADDFVLIAVANPRQQKRLDRIPGIVAALQSKLPARPVRAIIVGEAARTSADGASAQAALDAEIERWSMRERIVQLAGADRIRTLLAASDAFLSTSAFEGLSLAQLEALAAGVPVVTTEVGGAAEVAREMKADAPWYRLLPSDASAADFASALAEIPTGDRTARLPAAFHRARMTWRVNQLYHHAAAARLRGRLRPEGIWIITNNFSMGGAQSSARRLLQALNAHGVRVRAFTVQEDTPTRGSRALEAAGISVTAIDPAHLKAPARGTGEIIAEAAADPPEAILFWNLITSYKLLLADGLPGVRLFDVSPGEMNFKSLEQYFQRPLPELPYRTARDYGAHLAGAVVKFSREKEFAASTLGCAVTVIPNGVELQPHRERSQRPRLIFGTAARISPDKRLEDLLAAFALAHPKLPPYELHLAGRVEQGAAEYAKNLQRQGAHLPLKWRGELPGTAEFLRELDVFVMISEPAGCPNASLEAMAAGLPVIATDVGGAHEQVVDRQTGRLVPRRDAATLADAVVELARDAMARERYGRAARAHVAAEFSMEAMMQRYLALCVPVAEKERAVA